MRLNEAVEPRMDANEREWKNAGRKHFNSYRSRKRKILASPRRPVIPPNSPEFGYTLIEDGSTSPRKFASIRVHSRFLTALIRVMPADLSRGVRSDLCSSVQSVVNRIGGLHPESAIDGFLCEASA